MAHTKIVFTDYYYPDIDQEKKILGALKDVELVDCTKLVPGGVKDEERRSRICGGRGRADRAVRADYDAR